MKLANLKVGTRLRLGFALVIALMAALLAVAVVNMTEIEDLLDDIVKNNNHKTKLVTDMSESVHVVSRVTRTIVLLQTPEEIAKERKILDAARERYNTAIAALDKMPASEQAKATLAKIRALQDQARPLTNKVLDLAAAQNQAEAVNVLLTQAAPLTQQWQDALHESMSLQEKHSQDEHEQSVTAYRHALEEMFALGGLALAAALVIAWTLGRSITRPLSEAVALAETVAAGDLTSEIKGTSRDETGQLLNALGRMNMRLAQIVGGVRQGTETISSASKQIAIGNADLSQRTEEQASALEETASSMVELTSTVKQNAENASQANDLATSSSTMSVKGGEFV